MSPLPSRAAELVAPLPMNGMVAAAMAPPAGGGETAGDTIATATATVATPPTEPARTGTQEANVSAPAPVESAEANANASAQSTATTRDAPAMDVASQPALPAPALPAFVGKPAATATAHAGKPVAIGQSPASAGSIGGALFALVLVVGLILALGWMAKRMPGFRAGSRNSALRVVESLTLGPRERVVVVAVGNTQLLLGVGAGGTRTLHTLTEPLPVPESGTTPAFAQLLAQHFGKKA